MKKVVIDKAGSYDRLTIKEFPNPRPGKGEVLIETRACGINFADCCVRMGVYRSAKEFVGWPITPGFEVSGIVADIGEGADKFLKGQKVIAVTRFGGYATHLCVPEEFVYPLPESLEFIQGAAIPAVFLTAYYGLFELAHPRKDNVMLVHSAAGGVGSTLVQMGKLAGCRVLGVVGASHKVESVKSLGAFDVIDKSRQDLWKEAERLAPEGYDIIFDANGVETLRQSYQHWDQAVNLSSTDFIRCFRKGRGHPIGLKWFGII